MRKILVLAGLLACGASAALAQSTGNQIEIPLRVEGGRLLVPVQGPGGAVYNFTLNLGMTKLSESGATRIGDDLDGLTLGDAPVITEDIATVPDEELAVDGMVFDGVIGAQTLNSFDILIDVPGGRLVLKPIGRSVRWEGMALSNAVPLRVYHGLLLSVDVELEGTVFGGRARSGPLHLDHQRGCPREVRARRRPCSEVSHGLRHVPGRSGPHARTRDLQRLGPGQQRLRRDRRAGHIRLCHRHQLDPCRDADLPALNQVHPTRCPAPSRLRRVIRRIERLEDGPSPCPSSE